MSGRNRPVINLKELNKSTLSSFQNGRVFSVERIVDVWKLDVKNRSKRHFFAVPLAKGSQ